ncbi:hypothetical protein B0H13DRAFT_2676244 [Mycena leptocephala]|nr:hypothetical protein B0H13DRAFT_2676244 [Mycena leptocephala]
MSTYRNSSVLMRVGLHLASSIIHDQTQYAMNERRAKCGSGDDFTPRGSFEAWSNLVATRCMVACQVISS